MGADQVQAMKQQALNLLGSNRLAEAKELLLRVCEQNAEDVDAWYLLSCIHGMQGDMEKAGECCRHAIALRPDHSEAHVNLGNVLLCQGKLDEAVIHYKTALRSNPNNAAALCSLGNALSSLGKQTEAASIYQEALRLNPNFLEAHYNLGNLQMAQQQYDDAKVSFRHAIRLNPNYATAYNNLGNAYKESDDPASAIENYRTAIRIFPEFAMAYNNLAIVLKGQQMLDEAEDAAQQALRIQPDFADAHFNLGNIKMDQGKVEEAITHFQRTINILPNHAEACNNLGMALMRQHKFPEARHMIESALKMKPSLAEAACNLGDILHEQGDIEAAIEQYRRAVTLKPDYSEAYVNLGDALTDRRRIDEAVEVYRRAISVNPNSAIAYSNLASAYRIQLRFDEAEKMALHALEIQPGHIVALITLGNIYLIQGRADTAIAMYRKVLELEPDNTIAGGNMLMDMHYLNDYSAQDLYAAARNLGTMLEARKHTLPPPANLADKQRRLRLGYVSADFRTHPVGYFIEQVLAHHDKSQFEVVCYSNNSKEDQLTARLRRHADSWQTVLHQSDEALAQKIRLDGIDILVDLSGHTSGNCLPTFTHKPAPVQATWLGYFDTTGLSSIDYIIGDRFLIPPAEERHYSERVVRLPNAYLCFSPPEFDIEPGPLPAVTNAKITFGCFNHPAKLTAAVISCWSRLLQALPQAQLHLKYASFGDNTVRRRYLDLFGRQGINPERIHFSGVTPRHDYLATYRKIDIGLDGFPFNGCTTTMESLWMGVPVITLRGDRYVGHMGETILKHLGLEECIADNEDTYIARAIALASDLPRLTTLRNGLRQRLLESPLCDGPGFTRSLEAAYRQMWETWCQNQAQPL